MGADGFLGHHLVRRLRIGGRRVYEVGRKSGDLTNWANVQAALDSAPQASRLFHAVTKQRTGSIQYDLQGELLSANSRIHLNVLEAWRLFQPGAKLISFGSSCVYPEIDTPIDETRFQTGPLHPSVAGYGLAKQLLAIGAQTYATQYNLQHLHCVLATMYGPGMHCETARSHFIGGMFARAKQERAEGKSAFTVWGDPLTKRELLHVDDQIDAIMAADAAFANEIVLNCTAGTSITISAAAEAILGALNWSVPLHFLPNTFQGTQSKTLNSRRFLDRTGWSPKISLNDGLAELIQRS